MTMEEEKEVQTCQEELDGMEEKPAGHVVFKELKKNSPAEKAIVEVKTLPEHLKYVFLGENEVNSVIISSSLRKEEEDQLVLDLLNIINFHDVIWRFESDVYLCLSQFVGVERPLIGKRKKLKMSRVCLVCIFIFYFHFLFLFF